MKLYAELCSEMSWYVKCIYHGNVQWKCGMQNENIVVCLLPNVACTKQIPPCGNARLDASYHYAKLIALVI